MNTIQRRPDGVGGENPDLLPYQLRLMSLERENKQRLKIARREQDIISGKHQPAPDELAIKPETPPGSDEQAMVVSHQPTTPPRI